MSQEVEQIIEALLQARVFPDRLTLQREAYHALLTLRPELCIIGAVRLYQQGKLSFVDAVALSDLSREELKRLLVARGVFQPSNGR